MVAYRGSVVKPGTTNGGRGSRAWADRLLQCELLVTACHEGEWIDRTVGDAQFIMKMAACRASR